MRWKTEKESEKTTYFIRCVCVRVHVTAQLDWNQCSTIEHLCIEFYLCHTMLCSIDKFAHTIISFATHFYIFDWCSANYYYFYLTVCEQCSLTAFTKIRCYVWKTLTTTYSMTFGSHISKIESMYGFMETRRERMRGKQRMKKKIEKNKWEFLRKIYFDSNKYLLGY